MNEITTAIMSLAVIAAFLIGGSGVYILLRKPAERRKGLLMVLVGAITLVNVWMLSAPLP